ncbi:MAG: hypothetical protein ABI835_21295 [Chloroflexota bacterium]
MADDMEQLEAVGRELMQLYSVAAPPIPIERMLQHPHPDMWDEVDMNDFSATFLNVSTPYSPRMSLARFLARQIAKSPWGRKRGLEGIDDDESLIHSLARVLIMPADLVMEINETSRTPQLISLHFEVPEDDARLRLSELGVHKRR